VGLDRSLLDRYLTMYANADTLDLPPDARAAVSELFARGVTEGLFAEGAHAEFAG
jgi:predicted solute-binding protein